MKEKGEISVVKEEEQQRQQKQPELLPKSSSSNSSSKEERKSNLSCMKSTKQEDIVTKTKPDDIIVTKTKQEDKTRREEEADNDVGGEMGPRERLKRHRREVAGHVWIPDMWGQESYLNDWIDCSSFDASLIRHNIMLARASLIQEPHIIAPP